MARSGAERSCARPSKQAIVDGAERSSVRSSKEATVSEEDMKPETEMGSEEDMKPEMEMGTRAEMDSRHPLCSGPDVQ